MILPLIGMGTNGVCSNHCAACAHAGMQNHARDYQMPLQDVADLLNRLRELGHTVECLAFGGPGEPLLWEHFNAGMRLAYASGVAHRVEVTTNGKALHRIADDVWPMLNPLQISRYGYPLDEALIARHKNIVINERPTFMRLLEVPVSTRGPCCSHGMIYYRRRVWPHCFETVFDAARKAGMDPMALSVPVETFDPCNLPPLPPTPCEWCWGSCTTPKVVEQWHE